MKKVAQPADLLPIEGTYVFAPAENLSPPGPFHRPGMRIMKDIRYITNGEVVCINPILPRGREVSIIGVWKKPTSATYRSACRDQYLPTRGTIEILPPTTPDEIEWARATARLAPHQPAMILTVGRTFSSKEIFPIQILELGYTHDDKPKGHFMPEKLGRSRTGW